MALEPGGEGSGGDLEGGGELGGGDGVGGEDMVEGGACFCHGGLGAKGWGCRGAGPMLAAAAHDEGYSLGVNRIFEDYSTHAIGEGRRVQCKSED